LDGQSALEGYAKWKSSTPPAAAKEYSFEDMHAALFPDGPPKPKSLEELKEGIREFMRKRYANR
jgi:hypothetical protein